MTQRTYRAPGRVNVIGEHIDYLGGTVLPFAIDRELRITVEPSDDIDVRSPDGDVMTYARCVAQALRSHGYPVAAVRGDVRSDIPVGAGLSSSAALEAGLALALSGGGRVSARVLQEAGQLATGVPCGVMDQTAVLESKAGHALVLDCATGTFEHVAIPDEVGFVVIDTGTRRELADGRYAQRRAEVEAGELKRVRHAESEQRRVYYAVDALRAGDVAALGALVSDSHTSLRDDFEVSAPALDRAVQAACEHPACHGARLVGAGFAGCVLAVVEAERADDVVAFVRARLPGAHAFVVRAVNGASEVVLRAER